MAITCPQCNENVDDKQKFCTKCGTALIDPNAKTLQSVLEDEPTRPMGGPVSAGNVTRCIDQWLHSIADTELDTNYGFPLHIHPCELTETYEDLQPHLGMSFWLFNGSVHRISVIGVEGKIKFLDKELRGPNEIVSTERLELAHGSRRRFDIRQDLLHEGEKQMILASDCDKPYFKIDTLSLVIKVHGPTAEITRKVPFIGGIYRSGIPFL